MSQAAIVLTAITFFGLGLIFCPQLGFEYDEVVFVESIFRPAHSFFSTRLFHHSIPLMQISYAGALKTWAYAWVFKLWNPGAFSVRIPALFLASITIVLIGAILRRTASSRAAVFVCLLLASDLSFLLTSVFDWGPVVLQNFLLVTALYFLLVHHRKPFGIPAAAFASGLALWDKAIFSWTLSSLAISGFLFGFGVLRREFTLRKLAVGTVAFIAGAAPLIFYNLEQHGQTFAGNTKLSFAGVGPKFAFLRIAVNDQALTGFFVDESMARPPTSQGPLYTLGLRSHRCSSYRFSAFAVILLAGLAVARSEKRRLILWLELALALAWLQSALTRDAGGFVHHVVIFYPVLFIALGLCIDEIARRLLGFGNKFLATAGLLLAGIGLNVINAQYVDFRRFSPSTFWTDADQPLAHYLASQNGRRILIGDWGIATQADVRTRGNLPIEEISFGLKDGQITAAQVHEWVKATSVIVLHTTNHGMFPNQYEKLALAAKTYGAALRLIKTIQDRARHPMFEVYQIAAPESS